MTTESLLGHTSEIVRIMLKSSQPADSVMSEYLRSRKYIGASDRRFISGLAFHTLRTLSIAEAYQKHKGLRDLVHASYELQQLQASPDFSTHHASLITFLGSLPPHTQCCTQDWLLHETLRKWPSDAFNVWQAMMQPAPVCLRVNLRRATREKIIEKLNADDIECTPGNLAPGAIILAGRANILQHDLYKNGFIEIQDEGSQLISLNSGAAPTMSVLDACAGAGGKTLHLADIMNDRGLVVARDTEWMRLKEVMPRAQRAGIRSIRVERDAARDASRDAVRDFDVVLIDAPCSGIGTARRMPMSKWRLTKKLLEKHAARQLSILSENAAHVREGGALVYATCSILPTENEILVEQFLIQNSEFRIEFQEQWDPYHNNTDGLFVARLRKN